MLVSQRKLKQFLRPLSDATRNGVDLTVELSDQGALSWLAQTISSLLKRFHNALVNIARTAIFLSQQAPELAKLSKRLEERSQAQQANAEHIAAASQTLADTVESISSSAREASAFSQQVAAAADAANTQDHTSRQQIQAIGSSTRELAGQMELLKTSSASIGEVVELIKNIADRTRLLSLNAAIEAARAGEQGRGFAVVADEVRKLADQTMGATQNVEVLLATIQQQVTTSHETMETMAQQVDEGIQVSQKAGASIETASRDISTLIENVRIIAQASSAQSDKVRAITDQIAKVVESSQEQLRDAHTLASSATQMTKQCDELLTEVGEFRFIGHKNMRMAVEQETGKWQLNRLDADDLDQKLVALYQRENAFEMLCITDTRGKQISSDVEQGAIITAGRGNDWSSRRWFQEPLKQQQLFVSDLYRSVDSNEYCFTIGAPLFGPDKKLLGIMSADVRFNHIIKPKGEH